MTMLWGSPGAGPLHPHLPTEGRGGLELLLPRLGHPRALSARFCGHLGGLSPLSSARSVFSCSAIDYIQFLHKEKKKQEEEVSTLRKDAMALKIMKV